MESQIQGTIGELCYAPESAPIEILVCYVLFQQFEHMFHYSIIYVNQKMSSS